MSASRFTVTKPDEGQPIGAGDSAGGGENGTKGYGTSSTVVPEVKVVSPREANHESGGYVIIPGESIPKESDHLVINADTGDKHFALYEDESDQRPFVARVLSRMANYEGGVVPNVEQEGLEEPEGGGEKKGKKPKGSSKLGTVLGVYFPCIQNIFGVILFIRLTWVVGAAGWLESFFIVFLCCCCTMTTAISMSAVATNGVVAGGGSYFMISRALGPEFGGAVGILFYLGTSVASSMYIVGAVEILLQYMAPILSIFGPMTDATNAFNNYRVYGTILLLIMFAWVFLGVKFVSMFSPLALGCTILSIICIYIGVFVASPNRGPEICYVGERLISDSILQVNGSMQCIKNDTGVLYETFCKGTNVTEDNPDCQYFLNSEVTTRPGIPGLASGIIKENIFNHYSVANRRIGLPEEKGDREKGDIITDVATSFVILLAIFFPSCTGIMAGSNRSGDLADAQKSIPTGTIAAIGTTSFVYLSCVVFFGAVVEGQLLRDKFGESIGGGLICSHLAWPHYWVLLVGSLLSTVGAGLQSLTGAPRLLQAIAQDGVIPFLNPFAVTTKKGEPFRALLLTAAISEIGILIASLDYIAPIITMFFLMCYGFVNLACVVQSILKTPNWRPRFRFYHWLLSLGGLALCIALMFISSWYYALIAIAIAAGVYKYIEYKGAEKEWGDGIRGLAMSAARYSLLRLEEGPPHVKNWRPQLLILLKLDSELRPKYRKMLTFSSQLKAGKGLTLVGSILEGQVNDRYADAQAAQQEIASMMKKEKAKGFADVLVSDNVTNGINHLIQTAGVGGLRHNTVLLGWPYGWRHQEDQRSYRVFIDTLRNAAANQLATLIPKGIEMFPENNEKREGTIDIWWVVHDGGLLMLLPFLLTQHKVWKNCSMRIFTVAQMEDNSIQMKNDLKTFMYHLRLSAEVEVIELTDNDISAYTYERTLMMEQRTAIMKDMRLNKRDLAANPQLIIDQHRTGSPKATQKVKIPTIHEEDTPGAGDDGAKLDAKQSFAEQNLYTFTGTPPANKGKVAQDVLGIKPNTLQGLDFSELKIDNRNVRRMHTAVRLNEVIVEKSHQAALVILNLPGPPKHESGEENYMEFLEVLTEGLDRVLMVRGGGREVITIYS